MCTAAGDATANLMWRLQNGEVRKGLKAGVVVLHIGSSDLTYASFQVAVLSLHSLLWCSDGEMVFRCSS